MKLNRVVLGGWVLSAALMAPAAFAASITMFQNGGYSYGDGGEFTAYTTPDNFLDYYAPQTTLNGGFQTFCVELSVEFNPGVTYTFTESDTDSQGRPLTAGAALLYYDFAKGILPNYDYTAGSGRDWSAGQLQAAIWWLQGNQVNGGFPAGGTGNPFYDYAVSQLGINGVTAPSDGLDYVSVMELWDASGDMHQNQLVISGAPDSGTTAGFLGLAVVAMVIARRKMESQPALVPVRICQCGWTQRDAR